MAVFPQMRLRILYRQASLLDMKSKKSQILQNVVLLVFHLNAAFHSN